VNRTATRSERHAPPDRDWRRPLAPLRSTIDDRLAFLRLLRQAGTGTCIAMTAIGLVNAALPAAGAAATGWLLADLGGDFTTPLLVFGAVFLAGQLGGLAYRRAATAATTRIDLAHRAEVAALAVGTADVAVIERQDTQDLLKAAAADPGEWVEKTPGQGAAAALGVLLNYAGLVAATLVVAAWSPWLVPALLLPALAARALAIRWWRRHFRIWMDGIAHHRRYRYWGELPAARSEAKELRVFGLGDWVVDRHQEDLHRHLDPIWANNRAMALAQWQQLAVAFLPLAAVFSAVGYTAAGREGAVGLASAALTAGWGVFNAVAGTAELTDMEGSRLGIRALDQLRDRLRPAEANSADADRTPSGAPPLVRFEGLEFGYSERSPVMKGLDLELRPGETVAVVGFNGAGKSTLIKLLAGVYRPSQGRVSADGVDIAADPRWRSRLAVVFQDFVKYHLTVAENIALGAPGEPDLDLVRRAAVDAGLDGVVDGLEAGLDTVLERTRSGGVDLSGGQWQQLALARALYAIGRGARILVLDEPTAHLDVRTERALFDRLEGLTEGITTVLVSHRLSTVRRADRIVLLDGGRVAESGSHAELMLRGGMYARMYRLQAERYASGFDDRLEEGELR
jgi:ABC-type multidrug transport system fused ATPase/permease subunit